MINGWDTLVHPPQRLRIKAVLGLEVLAGGGVLKGLQRQLEAGQRPETRARVAASKQCGMYNSVQQGFMYGL